LPFAIGPSNNSNARLDGFFRPRRHNGGSPKLTAALDAEFQGAGVRRGGSDMHRLRRRSPPVFVRLEA
jgi:hypothetical protein